MLDAALTGRVLESTDFRVPQFATLDLAGAPVHSVVSRGKHLLIRVADLSIHSHLLMDGHWDVYAPGERWRSPAFKARCILRNADFQAVGFELGFLRVIRTAAEPEVIGHLGPDPLGHSWDPAEAERRLLADPARPIALALLDQRLIAGLGNIYRAELLFLARVHPLTPVGAVEDLPHLVSLAHQLMQANKDRTRRMTTTTALADRYWVYGRAGKPCLRCGTAVAHSRLADPAAQRGADLERDVFHCPVCQAEADPASGAPSAVSDHA